MKILYFILCSLINLSLMFLVFLLEFLLIAKINIIASSVFQLILVFFMIIISIVISYFVSSIIVKNAISKFFNLD
ncbi:hypothetical protein BmHG_00486 [Borrelia miyamotoi]|uniref:Uncharacterized protein n=1 Tax=Borrelia miyamotoi TaxID=47466 RepID=A0AAP8YRQ9_9SPIR|nr:hypothetical protein [Borrelia miyamotoi]AHH04936.1 Hypothetical protein BOM_0393 [Borrelia miyamotoi FR64b]ATQ14754.1 hypothetical protein CNO14_01895 [Borrelia miyamotoi]ATQ15939.1 hypothetical protein CNO13_01900 [Borrelia miyamotoi]ATQ17082.1 hypothetical protein CNO12_01900 [Borrelia miyamotoi]ATQ18412.1 hypothetical protein CNO11_02345 [Borrelia miyamotoi]